MSPKVEGSSKVLLKGLDTTRLGVGERGPDPVKSGDDQVCHANIINLFLSEGVL